MKITFEPDGVVVEETSLGATFKISRGYEQVEVWFKNPRPDVVRLEDPFLVIEVGLSNPVIRGKQKLLKKEVEK